MTFGLRFEERMAGSIHFQSKEAFSSVRTDVQYPFEINLHVFSRAVFKFSHPRQVRGYAFFPGAPLAGGEMDPSLAPAVSGEMVTTHRGVTYRFAVNFQDIGPLVFEGAKHYSIRNIVPSLKTLELIAKYEGKPVATARLTYVKSIWFFPLSMRLVREKYAFDGKLRLSEHIATLASIFVANSALFISVEELIARIRRQLEGSNWVTRIIFSWSTQLISLVSLCLFQRPIRMLSDLQRETLSLFLQNTKYLRGLAAPVSTIVCSAVFSSKAFLQKKKQNIVTPSLAENERWRELVIGPERREKGSDREVEVDVVVVGSGAGGAAAAYELASQGHAVAIIEEGHYFSRGDFTGDRIEMMSRLFRKSGHSFPISNAVVWMPTGRCVGGTTTINSGTCFRPPATVIRRWESELGIRDLDLIPYFSEVEQMLDVKPSPTHLHGPVYDVLSRGINGTSFLLEPLSRAETGCDGQSSCILGCPSGAKRSTDVSYIPAALKKNAYLFTHRRAEEVLFEKGRAVGVRTSLPGYDEEYHLTFRAKVVILAAGTLNTPSFLWRMGLSRELPALGKNLTIHPALTVGGIFSGILRKNLFVPQSLGILAIPGEDFVLEGYSLAIDAIPLAIPLYGRKLDELMNESERFANFSAMISDSGSGRLIFTKAWGAIAYYHFNKEMLHRLKRAVVTLAQIFLNAGAEKIYLPIRGFQQISDKVAIEDVKRARVRPSDFLNLSAFHPLGTCRMGNSPKNSVVSSTGEVWGIRGLYIADGSIIPGPLGVNPQITILANSLRVARGIGKIL